jgi:hypothetical protein
MGKKVGGISLGLWSEKNSYSQGEIKNVWVIESVDDKSRMSSEADMAFHAHSHLKVLADKKAVKIIPIGGVEDGIVGAGFCGGLSAELDYLKVGDYELVWEIDSRTSNTIVITITK